MMNGDHEWGLSGLLLKWNRRVGPDGSGRPTTQNVVGPVPPPGVRSCPINDWESEFTTAVASEPVPTIKTSAVFISSGNVDGAKKESARAIIKQNRYSVEEMQDQKASRAGRVAHTCAFCMCAESSGTLSPLRRTSGDVIVGTSKHLATQHCELAQPGGGSPHRTHANNACVRHPTKSHTSQKT